MAALFFCTVSSVNYADATADLLIPERENLMKTSVPVLDTVYNMPAPGETVVALFDDRQLSRGVVLGRPYHQTDIIDMTAKTVRVKQLVAESVTYHDRCEKG